MTSYFDIPDLADFYLKYRPQYPKKTIDTILHYANGGNGNKKFEKIVEVCCGSGQATVVLSPHAEHVLGTDISPNQIKHANERKDKADNVEFVAASAYDIPTPDKSVDLVTCAAGAHWLDLEKFLKECDRILKPNGTMAVYSYANPQVVFLTNNEDKNREKQLEIDQLTEEYTLKVPRPKGTSEGDLEGRYHDIYRRLPSKNKQKIDTIMPIEMSLRNWHGYMCSLTEYEKFRKNFVTNGNTQEMDAMQEYIYKMKSVYGVQDMDDNEVKVRLDFQFFYVFSKGPFVM